MPMRLMASLLSRFEQQLVVDRRVLEANRSRPEPGAWGLGPGSLEPPCATIPVSTKHNKGRPLSNYG
jgi:hypothetical protein